MIPEIIAKYIDSLNVEQRDKIISAKIFKVGGGYKPERQVKRIMRDALGSDFKRVKVLDERISTKGSEGCLIDHATDGTSKEGYGTIGSAFDEYYRMYGNTAINEIKKYCAMKNEEETRVEIILEQKKEEHVEI